MLVSWQQPYNSSASWTVQFGHLPGRCDPGSRSSSCGRGCLISPTHCFCTKTMKVPSCPSLLLFAQRQEKWLLVPANCSCSTRKNAMLAGSEIARCRGAEWACTATFHPMTKVNPSPHRPAVWSPLASVPINRVILYSSYNWREIFCWSP